jgi:hypothetical protein
MATLKISCALGISESNDVIELALCAYKDFQTASVCVAPEHLATSQLILHWKTACMLLDQRLVSSAIFHGIPLKHCIPAECDNK